MPVLLALSILAFVALLWATISIAGFVRRQRRRRRRVVDAGDASGNATRTAGLVPPPVFYREPEAVDPASQAATTPAEEVSAAQVGNTMEPADASLSAASKTQKAVPATVKAPPAISSPLPVPPSPEPPPRLRSFPTKLGKQPAAGADDVPPPWNPFSKDLGDLSDPVASRHMPAPRTRTRDTR